MSLRLLHYSDLETALDDPERCARLAGTLAARRDGDTVVIGTGDNTAPGALSLATEGRAALEFFRTVSPDVDTFGNHDFDHGVDALRDVVADSPQTWVCANAHRDGARFAGATPWTVVETATRRLGVVGVAHPETAELNPNAAPVRFSEPGPAVEAAVDALRERGVDRVAVLSHLGDDADLARGLDADVILGAHDHEPRLERVDGTLVCRPGGTARHLLEVSFDGEAATATHHDVADAPLDEATADALRERTASAGLAETVGTTDDPIVCDLQACKRGESRLGNLLVDAYRWKAGADVALNSGGGFRRRDPLAGDVTAFDLVSVTPYDSDLVVVRVDGEALTATLRDLALADAPDDLPEWHFGHVSGAAVVWDDEAGELRSARVGGDPVDVDASYDLATTEFFVANDELFPAFGPAAVVEHCGPQYEAVVEYVRETGLDPELEGRVRRPTLPEDAVPDRNWPHSP